MPRFKKIVQVQPGETFYRRNEQTGRTQAYVVRSIIPDIDPHRRTFEVTTEGGSKKVTFLKQTTVEMEIPEENTDPFKDAMIHLEEALSDKRGKAPRSID